jgi:hypothetical protein
MVAGELKEAWHCLKGWYSTVEDRAPKVSHNTLVHQTEERIALYARVPSAGEMLPIIVQPFDINDNVPNDLEIREVVWKLLNGQAAGATGLQAKHIKVWLWYVVQEEKEHLIVGQGYKLCIFVKLMQTIWECGCVPEQTTSETVLCPILWGINLSHIYAREVR